MNHRKRIATLIAIGAASLPVAAWSGGHRGASDGSFLIQAPVTHVQPLVRVVNVSTPQEVCWDEPVYRSANNYRSTTPTVLGGIIGGVLGNQVTRSRSRRSQNLATAAGALLGATLGRDHAHRNQQSAQRYISTQRLCEIQHVTHQEERIDGYRVTYEYRGRHFVTETATHPGASIPVRVEVEPLAYNDGNAYGRPPTHTPFRSKRFES